MDRPGLVKACQESFPDTVFLLESDALAILSQETIRPFCQDPQIVREGLEIIAEVVAGL